MGSRKRVVIMGAGGRDFHVFNTCYREAADQEVVAFTAAQIPHIEDRRYPPVLAGAHYPQGIPILPESELESIIRQHAVEHVVFAYSDVSFEFVQQVSERVLDCGASFSPFDIEATLLPASKPCLAVCAVRTGCGKSPFSRYLAGHLRQLDLQPGIIRHPMPYGNLRQQVVQRFATVDDLHRHHCTIEEMEEFEPHIVEGNVVFAGADYEQVVAAAEAESDVLLWDGGNNDTPFVRPRLLMTLLDPLRAGHELDYFPGDWNFRHADILVISKIDEARPDQLELLRKHIDQHNPRAELIEGRLLVELDDDTDLRGHRVLVVEDGPTITHGGMPWGAGYLAMQRLGVEIVDPREFAVGEIADALQAWPHIGPVLPALGYGEAQLEDLRQTIERAPCDVVVFATPVDLARVVPITHPVRRVTYSFRERGNPRLPALIREALGNHL
jgi:predicted GTPase